MSTDQDSPLGGPLELPDDAYPKDKNSAKKRKNEGRRGKTIVFVLIGLVVAGAVGFGTWKFVFNKSSEPAQQNQTSVNQGNSGSSNANGDVPAAELTEEYTSSAMRITFKYPKTWTVSESGGGVLITSPNFSFNTLNNGEVDGNFRIYIRKGAREQDRKYIGKGVAIMPSQKLVYTEPLPDQRTETNLSFFGDDNSSNFAFFLIAGNYELKKDDTLGPDYGKEPETFIIAGGYSGKALTDDLATYQVSTETFQQTNAYQQAVDILKSLQIK